MNSNSFDITDEIIDSLAAQKVKLTTQNQKLTEQIRKLNQQLTQEKRKYSSLYDYTRTKERQVIQANQKNQYLQINVKVHKQLVSQLNYKLAMLSEQNKLFLKISDPESLQLEHNYVLSKVDSIIYGRLQKIDPQREFEQPQDLRKKLQRFAQIAQQMESTAIIDKRFKQYTKSYSNDIKYLRYQKSQLENLIDKQRYKQEINYIKSWKNRQEWEHNHKNDENGMDKKKE